MTRRSGWKLSWVLLIPLAFAAILIAVLVADSAEASALLAPQSTDDDSQFRSEHLQSVIKRAFDIVVSALAILVLSPLLVGLALAVRLSSPGPVFYRAKRVGRFGQEFRLYKFRSMVVNADRVGPGITISGDRRITPVGRILRRTKLDELPQLINVFQGDMSLVGPRPEDPRYVALYTPQQRVVLNVRPGITSPASVSYRNEEALLSNLDWETQYTQEIMPAKLAIDLEYVQHASLARDVDVLARTFIALFR